MSNHHSQQSILLHHKQVNDGKERRLNRQIERHQRYLTMRDEARSDYQCILNFGFIGFAYLMFAVTAYTGYIWA